MANDSFSNIDASAAEVLEQGDDAFDDAAIVEPGFLEAVENDPSLDPALQIDLEALAESSALLDDPEYLTTPLSDRPNVKNPTIGADGSELGRPDEVGWNLDPEDHQLDS